MATSNGAIAILSELIILGSGCSSGVPTPRCLLLPADPPCLVCRSALARPPESNRNYRCNTSLLIKFVDESSQAKYIQIDAGKNFKEQVLRWFTSYQIPYVDAVILTHEHADAILGLDDIRGIQPVNHFNLIEPTPVFLSKHSMESVAAKFPYLMQKILKEGQEIRRVAQLDWKIIDDKLGASFDAAGLTFSPLPVMHGEDYICLGFLFGRREKVAYISDISRFPESTEIAISKRGAGEVDLLILDTLYKVGPHNTHFCLPETLDAIKRIQPKRALLVGMTHEFDHETDNAYLRKWSSREGIDVQLAYDGQRITIDL
ncbi:hypothetical protein GOP47_0006463 [Adiantum capillus-veneris]|uniref:Metallo-beta-lactamase domain-containing protein n=1 Tax=Adiantum capillus-veneris TaxID=13818 RepID=A0A9D4V4G1_ADICA|nr:hypothetical protein GOP47_0006463 [Adiantum capillus-veneris]